jgi:hypothetical protein
MPLGTHAKRGAAAPPRNRSRRRRQNITATTTPAKRQGRIYTAPDEFRLMTEREAMDGSDVLPGFRLPLSELFGHTEGAM